MKRDLSDAELFGERSQASRSRPSRSAVVAANNPLVKFDRKFERTEEKKWVPTPLVDVSDWPHQKNVDLDRLFDKLVVDKMPRHHNDGFGLAPSVLLLTSLFGPFNSGREKAKNFLLGEFKNFKIYYNGDFLQPLHVQLFAWLLRSYVTFDHSQDRWKLNSCGTVTIHRDILLYLVLGQSPSRYNNVGGVSPYYREKLAEMMEQLRSAQLKVVMNGDSKAGSGEVYIANFISEYNWSSRNNTFTFAIDRRIANIFALRHHSLVLLEEAARWKTGRIDKLTLDLQNKFRAMGRWSDDKKTKTAVISLRDLKALTCADSYSARKFAVRVAEAAASLSCDLIDYCTMSGFHPHDAIVMMKTAYDTLPADLSAKNIVGKSTKDVVKIIEAHATQDRRIAGAADDERERMRILCAEAGIRIPNRKPGEVQSEELRKLRTSRKDFSAPPRDVQRMLDDYEKEFGQAFTEKISSGLNRYRKMMQLIVTEHPERITDAKDIQVMTLRMRIMEALKEIERESNR